MDIVLIAVLIAWVPVVVALALLVGRTVMTAERREKQLRLLHQPSAGHSAPAAIVTTVRHHGSTGRAATSRRRSRRDHRVAS